MSSFQEPSRFDSFAKSHIVPRARGGGAARWRRRRRGVLFEDDALPGVWGELEQSSAQAPITFVTFAKKLHALQSSPADLAEVMSSW